MISLLLLILHLCTASSFHLTLLHTNDIHSHIDESDTTGQLCQPFHPCYGGMARLSTLIQKLRRENKHVLLVDGGDMQTRSVWYQAYKGNITADLMVKLGYDVVVSTDDF